MLKNKMFILSFIIVAGLGLLVTKIFVDRAKAVDILKQELLALQENLNEKGYDLAYDNLNFSKMPFFIMRATDFRIYSLDEDNYKDWSVPELKINANLLNPNKLTVTMSPNQYFQQGGDVYIIDTSELNININNKNLNIKGANLTIDDILIINNFSLKTDKKENVEAVLDVENIQFLNDINGDFSPEIKKFYVESNILDANNADIKKMILQWEPLTMVARGDISVDENLSPNIKLSTSAKGFIEFLGKLGDESFINEKGLFVAKVVIDGKAFKLKEDDEYLTVTTPVTINKDELTIENIPVLDFNY